MDPLTVDADKDPVPDKNVHVAVVALPPIVPLSGMVRGSHTAKSAPALTVAIGLTVAVTMVVGPLQAFAVGVIVYTTVPIDAFVVLSTWLMVDPFPFTEPVTLTEGVAVHVNVVPATFLGVGRILITAVPPLQIVTFDAVAEGNGFTVTTRSTDRPSQPLNVGMIR